MSRKVILYIAASLDGYIATPDGGLDFLGIAEAPPEDYGYHDFIKTVDSVIMGRKTYDKVLSFGIPFPHADKKCYVISKSRSGSDENVEYYGGNLNTLITQLKNEPGADIFIDGGADTVHALMQEKLIDRYIISTIPVLLGDGVSLFKGGRPEQKLKMLHSKAYPTGLVQSWYDVIEP